jgi:hypothetical protein
MKKLVYFSSAVLALTGLAACNETGTTPDLDANDDRYAAIAETFVNETVIPTYKYLADDTAELVDRLEAFAGNKSQQALDAACEVFLTSRAYWEKSEAFLFGAATAFGIDPHIDSWPLDQTALERLLASETIISSLAGEGGDAYAGDQLGNALLGFHGIEFILFRNGDNRTYTDITDTELTYAIAVAGDLRNRCAELYISWSGNESYKLYDYVANDLELNLVIEGSGNYYGEDMLKAGNAGSSYASQSLVMQAICDGCITIADEVATQKIGRPYNGTTEEDIAYIESPYSHKSIQDFYDNMVSIKNVYYGGLDAESMGASADSYDRTNSLHAWFQETDPDFDARMTAAIDKALAEINGDGTGMVKPFVNNRQDASVGEAIEAISALNEVLIEAKGRFTE